MKRRNDFTQKQRTNNTDNIRASKFGVMYQVIYINTRENPPPSLENAPKAKTWYNNKIRKELENGALHYVHTYLPYQVQVG